VQKADRHEVGFGDKGVREEVRGKLSISSLEPNGEAL
jgi:hypothetical protein